MEKMFFFSMKGSDMGALDKNRSRPRIFSFLNAMLESNGKSHIIMKILAVLAGNPFWRVMLGTIDLLVKIACFVKKKNIFSAADLK